MTSSFMLSSSRRISFMASCPSAIILSSASLPVRTGSGSTSISSRTSLKKQREMKYAAAATAAAMAKCPTLNSGNTSAYTAQTPAAM